MTEFGEQVKPEKLVQKIWKTSPDEIKNLHELPIKNSSDEYFNQQFYAKIAQAAKNELVKEKI